MPVAWVLYRSPVGAIVCQLAEKPDRAPLRRTRLSARVDRVMSFLSSICRAPLGDARQQWWSYPDEVGPR